MGAQAVAYQVKVTQLEAKLMLECLHKFGEHRTNDSRVGNSLGVKLFGSFGPVDPDNVEVALNVHVDVSLHKAYFSDDVTYT